MGHTDVATGRDAFSLCTFFESLLALDSNFWAVFVNFVAFGPFFENKIAFSRQIHLSERLFYFQNLHAMREEPIFYLKSFSAC